MTCVGLLHSGSKSSFVNAIGALKRAMPRGIKLVERYAEDDPKRLESLAQDLVQDGNEKRLDVIVAAGGPGPALLLKKLTEKIPIVFTTVVDPKTIGLVADLRKPGNNLTGMAGRTTELDPARLEILAAWSEAGIKKGDKIGVLIANNRVMSKEYYKVLEKTAEKRGFSLRPREAATLTEVSNAFADFSDDDGLTGVVVTADSFFNNHRRELAEFAAANRVPTIYQWKEFVDEGGLISHGPDLLEAYSAAGDYVTRILDGEKTADMSCKTASDPETYVNGHAARNLGIDIPKTLKKAPVHVVW